MHQLWPVRNADEAPGVRNAEIEEIYSYPNPLDRPYVRINYSSTASGKVAVDGRSAGLGSHADKLVYGRLRRIADVILVSAGTIRADRYRGARSWAGLREQRRARGQAEFAPIAIVTASADINVEGPLFTDTWVPPMILTVDAAPAENVSRLARCGADVQVVGEQRASVPAILEVLAKKGLYRVLCEGGASLFSDLIAADAVDEVCFTLAPYLGGEGIMARDFPHHLRPFTIKSILIEDDVLLLSYHRQGDTVVVGETTASRSEG